MSMLQFASILRFFREIAGPVYLSVLLVACSAGAPNLGTAPAGGGVGEGAGPSTLSTAQATGARQDVGAPTPGDEVEDDEKYFIYLSIGPDTAIAVNGDWVRYKILGVFLLQDGCPDGNFNARVVRIVDYNKRQYQEVAVQSHHFETTVDVAPANVDSNKGQPTNVILYLTPSGYVGEIGLGLRDCPASGTCRPNVEKNQILQGIYFPMKDPDQCGGALLKGIRTERDQLYQRQGQEPDPEPSYLQKKPHDPTSIQLYLKD